MILSDAQRLALKYVKENQPCKAMDIMRGTRMRHSALYNFLKTDYFIRSERIYGGSGSPKGGGFHYLYSINEDRKDPIICDRMKPIRITHHPIMRAMYGL